MSDMHFNVISSVFFSYTALKITGEKLDGLKTRLEIAKVSFSKLQEEQEVNGRRSQTTKELIDSIRAMEKADRKVKKLQQKVTAASQEYNQQLERHRANQDKL